MTWSDHPSWPFICSLPLTSTNNRDYADTIMFLSHGDLSGCLRKLSSHQFWLVGKDLLSFLERLFIVLDIVFLRFCRCFGILVCHSGTSELVLIQGIRAQNRGQSILAIWGAEMISVSDQFHTWSHRVTPNLPAPTMLRLPFQISRPIVGAETKCLHPNPRGCSCH